MDDSPKRFDRIVAILIHLQSKRIVKAQELADRFEVSLRTIYRDIRSIEASGVPIFSEAGVGYSLLEGYRLPPVMFTREEAASFIAAEKLMEKFTDKELGKHYASASYKLKAVLKGADKDWVNNIESHVLMQPTTRLFHEKAPDTLALLFKSIAERKQLSLVYKSSAADEVIVRIIEPVGVFHDNDKWYTLGYCHLREDYRQFRTDRIYELHLIDKSFTKEHQPLETYLQNDREKRTTTQVRILVDKKVAKHLDYEKNYHGFVAEKVMGNAIEMTFHSSDIKEGFSRWFMMFGDYATILEPEILKDRVLELLKQMQLRLKLSHSGVET